MIKLKSWTLYSKKVFNFIQKNYFMMLKQSFDTFRVFGCKILNLQSIDWNTEAEINCGIAHILGILMTNSCRSLTESTYFEKKLIFCSCLSEQQWFISISLYLVSFWQEILQSSLNNHNFAWVSHKPCPEIKGILKGLKLTIFTAWITSWRYMNGGCRFYTEIRSSCI